MENELRHHGVKGMKWGVRRYQNKDGTLTAAGKKRSKTYGWSKDAKTAERIKKKSVKQMTNKELQTLTKRMELENSYKRVNPNVVKRGIKLTATVAGGMGTILALQNNSNRIVDLGKSIVDFARNDVGRTALSLIKK